MGGTSVVNGMFYVRGNSRDFDLWESLGNYGWGYENVLDYFKKSEYNTDPHLRQDGKYKVKRHLQLRK